jgi:tetratricopeptide (TPR) repeat protein
MGLQKMKLNLPQDAILDYDRALALYPNFAQAIYASGMAKLQKGEIQPACQDLNKASGFGLSQADAARAQYCR